MSKPTRENVLLRLLDVASMVIEDIHPGDYPDFVDAYCAEAYWKNGTMLTESELDEVNEFCGDLIQEQARIEATGG